MLMALASRAGADLSRDWRIRHARCIRKRALRSRPCCCCTEDGCENTRCRWLQSWGIPLIAALPPHVGAAKTLKAAILATIAVSVFICSARMSVWLAKFSVWNCSSARNFVIALDRRNSAVGVSALCRSRHRSRKMNGAIVRIGCRDGRTPSSSLWSEEFGV